MKIKLIGATLALLVVVGGFVTWQRVQTQRYRWGQVAMKEKVARVPRSVDVATLARLLQKSGKVRDAKAFEEASRVAGLKQIAAGGYILPPLAGPTDLARIFSNKPDFVRVTFPEGWTAHQMAQRLTANGVMAAAGFEQLAYPAGMVVSPLEGFLFPATYDVPVKGTDQELVAMLKERFASVARKLPKQRPNVKGKQLTEREVVVLASMVERETSVAAERPAIAGVFLNRLRAGMRLQCDATVQYVRTLAAARGLLAQGHKERLLYSDLKLDSPYNTYRHAGLPPGPICNPGEAALVAAASPGSNPYLFYVMSPRGYHRFAKTFKEHRHNIALAKLETQAKRPSSTKAR